MSEPRLRTADRTAPPYPLNVFPRGFVKKLGAEIVYMYATKPTMSLEGPEWEQIFANCIGAKWEPSNVGLDDVILGNCCWSAKTVRQSSRQLDMQKQVRLISGRNSTQYSYGEGQSDEADPNYTGNLILTIWNKRVDSIRERFSSARTVVLIKGHNYDEYIVFEMNTVRYEPELFYFQWNKQGNLEGYTRQDNYHKFTWQPSGGQFTIIEDIPETRMHIKVRLPDKIDKETTLEMLGYNDNWVQIID